MSDTVGVRLSYIGGEMDARCCYFCAACWEQRPPDFDEAGCEPITVGDAGGACCEVCQWPLVDRLDVCVSCGDALRPAARGICPQCRSWAQVAGCLAQLRERALESAVSLSALWEQEDSAS